MAPAADVLAAERDECSSAKLGASLPRAASAEADLLHCKPTVTVHESPSSSSSASSPLMGDQAKERSKTLSGADGAHLVRELANLSGQRPLDLTHAELQPRNAWERAGLGVRRFYDRPVGGLVNLIYDCLQLSSGRDKVASIMQNYAKIASAVFAEPMSERYHVYRAVEDSLSDGRKIFRLFKEYREVYKIRRALHRVETGIEGSGVISIPTACGSLDVLAHVASFFFYLFDNLLWAASVGIVRAKEVPKWQREFWQGGRRNGVVIRALGGVERIKRRKNAASLARIVCAFLANVLLLRKALAERRSPDGQRPSPFEGPDDARLFHTIELIGMAASFRDLLSRLGYAPMSSHSKIGLLGIVSAVCGLWSNWRKVCKDQCGTKYFLTAVERRALCNSAAAA
eukprot:TRINITY_DN28621_c0_g1_i1.p1 TRINITY_DN28621_c0_g1~~TRINITY_DN28621_c0_g1_i1.p1  ORF type:complete len:400 (-),score=58.70 TRINITY_DN28621_c0_g1_i1:165-1364(-)